MPEQFPYPEEGWSTGQMRTRGEPLEDSPVRVAGMWDSLGKIFGFGKTEAKPTPEPTGKTYKADPMKEYPTDADAEFAKSHGFGYGTLAEPYIDQTTAKVYGSIRTMTQPPTKGKGKGTTVQAFYSDNAAGKTVTQILDAVNDHAKSMNMDLTKPEFKPIRDRIGHAYTKAALAVEGNAVAKLGFNPNMVMADVSGVQTNLSGAYRKKTMLRPGEEEGIYTSMTDPSAMVHESMHRGIDMLRSNPEAKRLLDKLPDEEMLVRYMMVKHAGDPEKLAPGGEPDKQRNQAVKLFEDKYWGHDRTGYLNQLIKIAEQEVAKKRPGGPR